jgi:uncharacterized protein DUF4126
MSFFTGNDILAIVLAGSFAAGLNVYATVATLGVLAHVHAFALPPALHLIESWPAIIVCALLFALEFVADKIPLFDLVWNALSTFVKVPAAAFLSYGATQHLTPGMQLAASVLGGAIALTAHGSKLAVRTAATSSPEPFSNIALSLAEDVGAVSLTWLATRHPIVAGIVAAGFLVLSILAIRYVIRALRRLFQRLESFLFSSGSRAA